MSNSAQQSPLTIRMHERDNVAIVANDGGLSAGTAFPSGLNDRRRETVPASELVVGVRKRSWIIGQGFRQAEPTHLDYLIDRQRFEHRHQAVRTTRGPAAGDHKCRLYWRRSAMVIAGPHASFRP